MRPVGTLVGAPQGYWEYLPPGYGDGAKRPLLVSLHGSGSNGTGHQGVAREAARRPGIPKLIEDDKWPAARPFIVLMPQHTDATGDELPERAGDRRLPRTSR